MVACIFKALFIKVKPTHRWTFVNTKCTEPQMSPDDLNIFGSYVACDTSRELCELGVVIQISLIWG